MSIRADHKVTDGSTCPVHTILGKAIEKRQRAYLWTPTNTIAFVPRLLPTFFGDGRALFTISTINQRPAFWVIRACSTWGCAFDDRNSVGPDFSEIVDDILDELENAFGSGRCGYRGNNLFMPKRERVKSCRCEECLDRYGTARWPMVDRDGGCSWGRLDWPRCFDTVNNPVSPRGNLLAIEKAKGGAA